jgi:carbonic anhydrase/acetyltransferase-like protein (isoleucine patch superfamily)
MLGARMGRGIQVIGGRLTDPPMVRLGDSVIIGDDAMVMGHAITGISTGDALIMANTEIKSGALIGARSLIFPGAIVGEGSIVNAGSIVPMNMKIPDYEIWGGIPAVKIKDIPRPRSEFNQ